MFLQVTDAVKQYGTLRALDGVSIAFQPGTIHAVVGENGAGKSTLMTAIAGLVRLDAGSMELDRQPFIARNPREARDLGVGIVYQHFKHVPTFDASENLALARLVSPWGLADIKALSQTGQQIAHDLGWSIPGDLPADLMPVGTQQRLEIVKVLASDARVIILDEPTAVLSPDEVDDVFRVLRELKARGKTIIVIAHKLSEVFSIADHITVLRRGRVVGEGRVTDLTPAQVAEWMIGDLPALHAHGAFSQGAVVAEGKGVAFHKGEIVGIGGVDGNGQVEFAESLAYLEHGARKAPCPAFIPQDRQTDGLAIDWSIEQNLWVGGHAQREFRFGPFLRVSALRDWAKNLVQLFQVKAQTIHQSARSLSGGNQQKVVVARALSQPSDFVVALNPTRGLDVGSAAFVHEQLRAVASRGGCVALFSTDLDELFAIADRVFVMVNGEVRPLDSASSMVGAD